nr:reverse transcriptase domain-containing protein [Tanacetum cinerariifolium]
MLVEVGKFTFPIDFVILEMEEDSKVPLILGRPFLHTADAVIRVKQKQLNFGVGTERMMFNIDSAMKHSYSNDDTCFSINVIDEILEEDFDALLDEGSKLLYSVKGTLREEKIFFEFDEFMILLLQEFDIEIKDKKGTENVVADHFSRIENEEISDDSQVDDNFPRETLMEINTKDEPWFADFANYLVADIKPKGMTYQQKNKFFSDLKHYFWRNPTSSKYVLTFGLLLVLVFASSFGFIPWRLEFVTGFSFRSHFGSIYASLYVVDFGSGF